MAAAIHPFRDELFLLGCQGERHGLNKRQFSNAVKRGNKSWSEAFAVGWVVAVPATREGALMGHASWPVGGKLTSVGGGPAPVRHRLDSITVRPGSVRDRLGSVPGGLDSVCDRLASIRHELGSIGGELGSIHHRLKSIRDRLGSVRDGLGSVCV